MTGMQGITLLSSATREEDAHKDRKLPRMLNYWCVLPCSATTCQGSGFPWLMRSTRVSSVSLSLTW